MNQAFRETPRDSRYFAQCLITQFACNIFMHKCTTNIVEKYEYSLAVQLKLVNWCVNLLLGVIQIRIHTLLV